jgi:transcription elongation factor Elf1
MNGIYADQQDSGLLVCPNCGRKKVIEISKYTGRKLRINCTCGQTFACRIKDNCVITEDEKEKPKSELNGSSENSPPVFLVEKSGKSVLNCPKCGFEKEIQIPLKSISKAVYTIKCKCGEKFHCRFEPIYVARTKGKQTDFFSLKNRELGGLKEQVCFVAEDGKTSIVCDKCGSIKSVKCEEMPLLKQPFGFRCKCGHAFPCRIDERSNYRKSTALKGEYINRRTLDKNRIVVKDISFTGIGIMVTDAHDIRQGDVLEVNFVLNDMSATKMNRLVRVMRIDKKKIGCKFIKEHAYDKKLGFYLLN